MRESAEDIINSAATPNVVTLKLAIYLANLPAVFTVVMVKAILCEYHKIRRKVAPLKQIQSRIRQGDFITFFAFHANFVLFARKL